jgi:ABC-type sugar transport system substrate-binding protein
MLVRADNVRMGEEACMEMGERLGGEGKVLNVNGDNAVTNGRNRTNGFNDCMAENFPNIEVINEAAGSWRPEDHTRIVQTTLGTVPDLAGIYLQSDAVALSGALAALDQAGKLKKVGEEGHITLLAIDGTPESLEAIREGYLDATISQPIDLYSQYGVQYAQAAVGGVVFEPGPTDHDSTIVQETGGLADELPSPVVTSENVEDPDLWGNKAAG